MKQIENSYLGNPNLKASNVKVEFTKEQVEEYVKCSKDPIYFMKKYIQIVSLDKGLIPFELYDFQEKMVDTFVNNRFTINQQLLFHIFFITFYSITIKMLPFLQTS